MGYYSDPNYPTPGNYEKRRKHAQARQKRMEDARAKGTHTKEEWREMYEASGPSCARCGFVGHVCKDHIVPVCLGGSDSIRNLQPMCRECNSSKGPEDTDFRINKPWMRPEWARDGE